MCFTLVGLVLLSQAASFGSCCSGRPGRRRLIYFHPEASRLAYLASGGRRGMAQSLFQVGGNAGASLGPLLAAQIIAPYGQSRILWFCLAALLAIGVLIRQAKWYSHNLDRRRKKPGARPEVTRAPPIPPAICTPTFPGAKYSWPVDPAGAESSQVLLHGQHEQVLYVLPDG